MQVIDIGVLFVKSVLPTMLWFCSRLVPYAYCTAHGWGWGALLLAAPFNICALALNKLSHCIEI